MERRLPDAPILPDALAITVEMIECGCSLLHCMSLLLAQSGHPDRLTRCPLLGVKRTLVSHSAMSAFDPKRTSAALPARAAAPAAWLRSLLIGRAAGARHERQRHAFRQVALAWNEVDLEANAVRILEQDRVIAGRPGPVLRGVHELAAERRELCDEEGVKAIDVLAATRAEAQVMQAWLVLVVAGTRVLRLGGADRQPSLAADEVEDPALGGVAFQILLAVHLEVLAQRAIERTAARQIRDRELHVGDPCELHGRTIASARCHGKAPDDCSPQS